MSRANWTCQVHDWHAAHFHVCCPCSICGRHTVMLTLLLAVIAALCIISDLARCSAGEVLPPPPPPPPPSSRRVHNTYFPPPRYVFPVSSSCLPSPPPTHSQLQSGSQPIHPSAGAHPWCLISGQQIQSCRELSGFWRNRPQ